MIFLIALVSLLVAVIGQQLHFSYRRRKLGRRSWEDVLGEIEPVHSVGLRLIADCYLQPDQNQLRLEPGEMWDIIGGREGLERLRNNAALMLELASFAQRWNGEEGPIVTEVIRRDVVRIRRTIRRMQLAYLFHGESVQAQFCLQEVVSSYSLLRRRLLGLYHNNHIALLPRLEAAL